MLEAQEPSAAGNSFGRIDAAGFVPIFLGRHPLALGFLLSHAAARVARFGMDSTPAPLAHPLETTGGMF